MEKMVYDYVRFNFKVTEQERNLIDSLMEEIDCDEVGAHVEDLEEWGCTYSICIEFNEDYKGNPEKTVANFMKVVQEELAAFTTFNIDSYIGREVELVGGRWSGETGVLVACPCAIKDASKRVLLVNEYDSMVILKEEISFAKLVE